MNMMEGHKKTHGPKVNTFTIGVLEQLACRCTVLLVYIYWDGGKIVHLIILNQMTIIN